MTKKVGRYCGQWFNEVSFVKSARFAIDQYYDPFFFLIRLFRYNSKHFRIVQVAPFAYIPSESFQFVVPIFMIHILNGLLLLLLLLSLPLTLNQLKPICAPYRILLILCHFEYYWRNSIHINRGLRNIMRLFYLSV